jgi:acyl-coenzyme A thioesterase PaaI-like protein
MAGVGAERLIIDDGRCFACGPHNEHGLQLDFLPDGDDGAQATVTLASHLQGYREIAHGGIVMMLLDEVMAHACRFINEKAMTAAVDVRFRAPVPLGKVLTVRGRFKERRRKFLYLEGTVSLDDTVLATAEGTFVSLGPLHVAGR